MPSMGRSTPVASVAVARGSGRSGRPSRSATSRFRLERVQPVSRIIRIGWLSIVASTRNERSIGTVAGAMPLAHPAAQSANRALQWAPQRVRSCFDTAPFYRGARGNTMSPGGGWGGYVRELPAFASTAPKERR